MGMGIFEMVVWIVGISCVAGVASSWIKSGGGGGAELANELDAERMILTNSKNGQACLSG